MLRTNYCDAPVAQLWNGNARRRKSCAKLRPLLKYRLRKAACLKWCHPWARPAGIVLHRAQFGCRAERVRHALSRALVVGGEADARVERNRTANHRRARRGGRCWRRFDRQARQSKDGLSPRPCYCAARATCRQRCVMELDFDSPEKAIEKEEGGKEAGRGGGVAVDDHGCIH